MKTKLGASLIAALMMMGLFGAASATADPGPHHGNNKQGLCTAYFNGSEQGQANKRSALPFVALEDEASDDDDGTTPEEDVAAFCEGLVGGRAGGDKGTPGRP